MIACSTVKQQQIRRHYDLGTLFYRILWGPHIHHGLWTHGESARDAQIHLTDTLAHEAGIQRTDHVLDVGCGMGGSAIHLAATIGCDVTGITLSPVQRAWAANAAWWQRRRDRTRFLCADAETIVFEPESFDVVWSVECTEHLFDKPGFFRRAASWLKPNGRVAICAWLADDTSTVEKTALVHTVCDAFLCPSLGRESEYVEWMSQAGLEIDRVYDWTDRVLQTWEICQRRVRRTGVRWLARCVDHDQVRFLNHFSTILAAYKSGAMKYGCLVGHKAIGAGR